MRFDPALVALLVGVTMTGPAVAGQEGTDMKLEDMGFIMRAATTPGQMERLRLLPPRKFVRRTKEIAAIISTPIQTFAGAYLSGTTWR